MSTHSTILEAFPNFSFERTLSSSRSTIILTKCSLNDKNYILKAFSEDSASHSRFTQEKEILSKLSHSHIIKCISNEHFSDASNKSHAILMEYAPYGDFFNFTAEQGLNDEKLVRTYFHQLINGLEHLHSKNIAHLDLKLENLLIGEDFNLKIADFDLSRKANCNKILISGGTANYRAPEILAGCCINFTAADVYSAGICLYGLMARAFPFIEERNGNDVTLFRYDTFTGQNDKFWEENEELVGEEEVFSSSLRELINSMLNKFPSKRITLAGIRRSGWFNGPTYSKEEIKTRMEEIIKSVEEDD